MTVEPEALMTWGAQLARAERILAAAGVRAPRDEAIELLGTLLDAPSGLLLALPASAMSQLDVEAYGGWVARRAGGEALPHITGRLMFMGLEFAVGRNSPLPAVWSWQVVEVALQVARRMSPSDLLAAEIGTGCGAVALALAAFEPRFTRIYAVDGSAAALETAAANGARYLLNLVINWVEGAGLDFVPEPVDVIVCGHPDQRGPSLTRLLEQAPAKLRPGGALVWGAADGRETMAAESLARAFPDASVWVDSLAGELSVAVAQLPDNR